LKKLASRPRPVRALSGDALERYCARAAELILNGRLSRAFPDPQRCAATLAALAPSARGGYRPEVAIDLASGLPAIQEMAVVVADAALAAEHLRTVGARRELRLAPVAQAKADYYRRLIGQPVGSLHGLEVRLRRIDAEERSAAFEVVFDRYDAAESVFTRYTILLEQKDALWGRFIDRHGDYSKQTDAFRAKMERFTQDDSELAFLLLGQVEGLRVEEVVRGRIGPLWSPWAPAPPEFGAGPGDFILHLPLDRASLELEQDRNDDPFSTMYRAFLSSDSRMLVEEQAQRLGYRVHKDRKFSVSRGAAAALKERLARAKTMNIVYEA